MGRKGAATRAVPPGSRDSLEKQLTNAQDATFRLHQKLIEAAPDLPSETEIRQCREALAKHVAELDRILAMHPPIHRHGRA